jgi:hydroxymethylpyrimidine/phosphomethylpyrimidine kinase
LSEKEMQVPVALTIAGSDPSGGAGLQADLKTFHQHGVYGMSVVTLLTVQNTQTVSAVEWVSSRLVADQLAACLSDIPPAAAKTGALGNAEIIQTVAAGLAGSSFPLVVDPVMISKHNVPLLDNSAIQSLKKQLLPVAFLVTPNVPEATALTGRKLATLAEMVDAARAIRQMGPANVLIKGGHLGKTASDVLLLDEEPHLFTSLRYDTPNTHGTGCVTSAAIAARLALGESLLEAVGHTKEFIGQAIQTNPNLGRGYGPVNLFVKPVRGKE